MRTEQIGPFEEVAEPMMDTIYLLCGIMAVSAIVMGMIGGVIWLLS